MKPPTEFILFTLYFAIAFLVCSIAMFLAHSNGATPSPYTVIIAMLVSAIAGYVGAIWDRP